MNHNFTATPIVGKWAERVNALSSDLTDYETGGATLGTASDSVEFEWRAEVEGDEIFVSRDGVSPVSVVSAPDVTLVSLAFDSTMNPHIAYVSEGTAYMRYWDTLADDYSTLQLPGARTPRLCTDEKNPLLSQDRDIILAYLREDKLYYRFQRDRFGIEYEKVAPASGNEPITNTTKLVSIGRIEGFRVMLRFFY